MADQGFGTLLREHRQNAELSQEELAHRAGLSPQAISLLERGARKHPRRQTIDAIVNALQLDLDVHAQFLTAARRTRTAGGARRESQAPQLTASFTGRQSELKAVIDALSSESARGPAVAIVAIDGMAGCGKTTLATKAAHELTEEFPDGCLFIDLHGFTEGLPPENPLNALSLALRSLGLPGQAIPETLDERSALYRSVLARRRMLVVLDNAAGSDQVLPLLPGSPGSAVISTSRTRLPGIGSSRIVSLSPMSADDAKALFAKLTGARDDDQAIYDLLKVCGNLPLAVEIAAARAIHEGLTVRELVQSLAAHQRLLFEPGSSLSSLTTVFEASYKPLTGDQQLIFRLMSLNPGPTMDEHAVAAASQLSLRTTRIILDDLVDRHLVIEDEPSVYGFHDLIRSYAFHQATSPGLEVERLSTVRALESHYLSVASRAMDLIHPAEVNRRPSLIRSASESMLTDKRSAEGWMDREADTLLKIAGSDDKLAMQVIGIIMRHLQTRGRWHDAGALLPSALRSAQRTSGTEEARALLHFALFRQIQGQSATATDLYAQALQITQDSSWTIGQIMSLLGLGETHRLTSRQATAAEHYHAALGLADSVADRAGQLRALLGLGDVQCERGAFADADSSYRRSLSIAQEVGDDFNAINAQVGLGDIDFHRGRFDSAIITYKQALELADRVQIGPVRNYALGSLADAYRKAGRYQEAILHTTECYEYAESIGDRVAQLSDLQSLVECLIAVGNLNEAESRIEQLLGLARQLNDRDRIGRAYRFRGLLLQKNSEPTLALDAFSDALQIAQLGDMPLDVARAHLAVATCLASLERTVEAQPHLIEAISLYRAIDSLELDDALALQARLHPEAR